MEVTYTVTLLCLFTVLGVTARCPKVCTCSLKSGRKTVFCSAGDMPTIPVSEMDINSHVLVITAPPDSPNNITLGRIFLKFNNLELVRIQRSGVPAIGDSSFWPGRRLKVLDLSHNSISFLRESDFNGLKNLQELDLSDNDIFATPSAPFRHLISLKKLSLARNKLQTLVPRFFYLLSHLEELDLSGNAIGRIEPENLQDVKQLKVLRLSKCRLTHLHPIIYQKLPHLETLDLRDNLIASLAPAEYRHLANLAYLYLDRNLLTSITEGTFHGQRLRVLGISRNDLSSLSERAFTNSSVQCLDISHNRLEYVLKDSFEPLSESLEILNISFNDLGNQAFAFMISPLKSLRQLHASNLLINNLYPGAFVHNGNLRFLNLSRNNVNELLPMFLIPLENLEVLDLSYNLLATVPKQFLQTLTNITTFQSLNLLGNPFDCAACGLRPLLQGLNESQFLEQNCSQNNNCLRCHQPRERVGRYVHTIPMDELMCLNAVFDRQYLQYTSQVGLIVAVSIIVIIVCIILIIIIIYRRHIAHYYTHEEERRAWKGMYENPALAPSGGVHYSDEKPTFISTPDKVDENIDDFHRPANIMR